ncbi:hypothetical protein [Parasitella parasitica]|uniref:Myb-like domain-containing protein n=1 Tax=Parasitella parasitica TaxID=35722 RepID=A0A0B7MRK9_9FUNG|nr:hypothetical protein [Parasitella parasitica]
MSKGDHSIEDRDSEYSHSLDEVDSITEQQSTQEDQFQTAESADEDDVNSDNERSVDDQTVMNESADDGDRKKTGDQVEQREMVDNSSDGEIFQNGTDADLHSDTTSNAGNNSSEVYELTDDDDDYEDEDEDKTAKAVRTNQTELARTGRNFRGRITDAQPTARELTAEEADFADSTESHRSRKSGDSNQKTSSLPAPSESPSSSSSRSTRSTQQSRSSTKSSNIHNDQSTSHKRTDENTSSNSPSVVDVVPEGYYIVEKTQQKRKVAKTRTRTLRWTDEEVKALEDGLNEVKKRAWASILSRYRSRLGEHTQTQLKDKAVNEVKRRKKLKLPLGGFYFVDYPLCEDKDDST